MMDAIVKRWFDCCAASAGLLVLMPVLVVAAVLINREDGGPVFYRGVRIGLNGVPFRMFKFRTMVMNADKIGAASTADDDFRITRVGRKLRTYKLDELPQLINVVQGRMSLVGPRPQVPWAVGNYSENERRLLLLRPGITDPASLRFSNEGALLKGSDDPDRDYMDKIHPVKMVLSLAYLEHRSVFVDLEIIVKTIRKVLTGN